MGRERYVTGWSKPIMRERYSVGFVDLEPRLSAAVARLRDAQLAQERAMERWMVWQVVMVAGFRGAVLGAVFGYLIMAGVGHW